MMRRMICAAVVATVLTGVAGCDAMVGGKFELVQAGNRTYLVNKSTGETKLVNGTKMTAVSGGDERTEASAQKSKTWDDQAVGDLRDVKFSVRTKHRDGQMMYIVTGAPFDGPLERAWSTASVVEGSGRSPVIFFDLLDEEGFKVGEPIEIRMRAGTRTVDEKGVITEMRWTGSRPMPVETYREATSVESRWSGFARE